MNGYNFTENVRKALATARLEAARLDHEYVDTQHILIALLKLNEGIAAAILANMSVDLPLVWEFMEASAEAAHAKTGRAKKGRSPDLPYTSRAKKVLELAMNEAREFNHSYVGTEHLLLGLLREEKGVAGRALRQAGASIDLARTEMLRLVGAGPLSERAAARYSGETVPERSPGGAKRYEPPNFSRRAVQVVERGRDEARRRRVACVRAEHLLLGLLLTPEIEGLAGVILARLGLERESVTRTLQMIADGDEPLNTYPTEPPFDAAAKKVLDLAIAEAWHAGESEVGTAHLLFGIAAGQSNAAAVLSKSGVTADAIRIEHERLRG